jgi:hypothetical protein
MPQMASLSLSFEATQRTLGSALATLVLSGLIELQRKSRNIVAVCDQIVAIWVARSFQR